MSTHSKSTDGDGPGDAEEVRAATPGTIWRRPAPRAEVDVTLELSLSDGGEPTRSPRRDTP